MEKIDWEELSKRAWKIRENAFIYGNTKVGAALISKSDTIYVGCNIEQQYRNKDIHAEVNAITNMINNGEQELKAILVVAERDRFTPCGCCMDWIFQFGGPNVLVGYQTKIGGEIKRFSANKLMPYYPH